MRFLIVDAHLHMGWRRVRGVYPDGSVNTGGLRGAVPPDVDGGANFHQKMQFQREKWSKMCPWVHLMVFPTTSHFFENFDFQIFLSRKFVLAQRANCSYFGICVTFGDFFGKK